MAVELYVVTRGLPGRGVSALIHDAGRELIASAGGDHTKRAAVIRETLDAVHAKLRQSPPCEFVELEDEHGASVGPQSSGAQWGKNRPGEPPLFHLGPFAPRPQDDAGAEEVFVLGDLRVTVQGRPEGLGTPLLIGYPPTDEAFERLVEQLGGPDRFEVSPDGRFAYAKAINRGKSIDREDKPLVVSLCAPRPRAATARSALQRVVERRCDRIERQGGGGPQTEPGPGAGSDERGCVMAVVEPEDIEIDYDRLNAASRTLYDAAFAEGKRVGGEKARSEMAERHAEGLLELAARLLEEVVGWPRETDADLREQRQQMKLVRMVLGATPYTLSLDKAITQASKALLRRGDAIDLGGAVECQRAVERLREAMRSGDAS